MAVSSTPTLREIITEVYGKYDSSKSFESCQSDALNKKHFTSSKPITSMRSWAEYSDYYLLTVMISFMDARALGYTEVDAHVEFEFAGGAFYKGSLDGFTLSMDGMNLLYTRKIKVTQKRLEFGHFLIGGVVFDNTFIIKEGMLGFNNPMNSYDVFYDSPMGAMVDASMIEPPYIDTIDPFEVRVVPQNISR